VPQVVTWAQRISTLLLDPLGQVFLRLLLFVVIPLVFASLVTGVVQLDKLGDLGSLAGRTFSLFALNMVIGVALGLLMMNMLSPGEQLDTQTQRQLIVEYSGAADAHVQTRHQQPSM